MAVSAALGRDGAGVVEASWGGVCGCSVGSSWAGAASSEGTADRAHAAADRAIVLDPRHPDGYRALGDYYLQVAGNASRAAEFYSKGLTLAPDDADLLRVQPAERYGDGLAVAMEVEEDARFYTVTDIADGKVVLDGNHPLAGMALRFSCRVVSVRTAKAEEIERGVSLP